MNYGNKYQIGQKVYFVSEGFLICAAITGFGMYVYASDPEKPSFVYMFEKCSSVSESDLFPTFDEANGDRRDRFCFNLQIKEKKNRTY